MKRQYKQELVLQLPANSVKDYDTVIELENCIAAGLENFGEVDGHDMGSGETNTFVRTDCPKLTFDKIKSLVGTKDFMPDLKVAFRDVGKANFTVLYPVGFAHFKIV
jgi:hypothetical protein